MTDLEALWHSHRHRIASYIARRVMHRYGQDTVDDLVSITYLRALVAMRNGNGVHTNAEAWLFAIARSAMMDFWRDMQRMTFIDYDALVEQPASESTYEDAIKHLIAGRVRGAVAQLAPTHTQAVQMRLEGYSHAEIAEVMGIGMETAKARGYRGMRALQIRLQDVVTP